MSHFYQEHEVRLIAGRVMREEGKIAKVCCGEQASQELQSCMKRSFMLLVSRWQKFLNL